MFDMSTFLGVVPSPERLIYVFICPGVVPRPERLMYVFIARREKGRGKALLHLK